MEISTILKEECDRCFAEKGVGHCEGCGIDWAKHKLPAHPISEHLLSMEQNQENLNLLWQVCYRCNDLENCSSCVIFRTKVGIAVKEQRNERVHNN